MLPTTDSSLNFHENLFIINLTNQLKYSKNTVKFKPVCKNKLGVHMHSLETVMLQCRNQSDQCNSWERYCMKTFTGTFVGLADLLQMKTGEPGGVFPDAEEVGG